MVTNKTNATGLVMGEILFGKAGFKFPIGVFGGRFSESFEFEA